MISVIVLNWNGKEHLDVCLSSLYGQDYTDLEVILVDNGSTDGSVQYVAERFPAVRLLPLDVNLGFCGGNNVGIRQARGDLIALLNNDTEASPQWLRSLYEASLRWPGAGFFASRMLHFDRRDVLDSAGDQFHTAGFASKRGFGERDAPVFGREEPVFGACAGAALYRRTVLDCIGLLDEDFFANAEDVDLSFRAQLHGYRCIYVPDARVYHKIGATIKRNWSWFYWSRRNLLWVLVKNMPAPLLIKYWPGILAYNASSLLYHTWYGRGRLILGAYLAALRGLRPMLAKRRRIQSARTADVRYIDSILTRGGIRARARSPYLKGRQEPVSCPRA